jgi:pyruvate/2-oxoglutarate dehydrogenase complex dihydrolipoamide acyltransferase (E2) component
MDFRFPKLADTLGEGVVARWLKQPGDVVREGEPLVEVETDKVNSELESPADGVLAEIVAPEGTTVPVGEVLARITTRGDGTS